MGRYKCSECSFTADTNRPPDLYALSTSDGNWIVCRKCFNAIWGKINSFHTGDIVQCIETGETFTVEKTFTQDFPNEKGVLRMTINGCNYDNNRNLFKFIERPENV